MTCFLPAVTTLSVPKMYTLYMQGVWPGGCSPQLGLSYHGVAPALGKARHLHVHCLNPQVNGGTWLDLHGACCHVWIVSSTTITAGLYAPQGVELVLEWTGPTYRRNSSTDLRMAFGQTHMALYKFSILHHYAWCAFEWTHRSWYRATI